MKEFAAPMFDMFSGLYTFHKNSTNDQIQLPKIIDCLNLLLKIYYSLNWVDLPEFFEDKMKDYFGMFHELLTLKSPILESDDDSEPGLLEKTKATIFTIANLYLEKYDEEFSQEYVQVFTNDCWTILTLAGPQLKYDRVVAKGLTFLTAVAKSGNNQIFAPDETLKNICEKIVIPNLTLRSEDEEIFEDEPIEYIRRDLEGSDNDTRRRAAVEFVKGLCMFHEQKTTNILMQKINTILGQTQVHWKHKDLCIYLMISISVKAKTEKKGATQINSAIDVMGFLQNQILPELNSRDLDRLILQADAIKYVAVFRQLLPKDAFKVIFPLLINLLVSNSRVVQSYAAWCIERWLNVKETPTQPRYNKDDVKPFITALLTNLFQVLTAPNQKENEYVMKAIMRVTAVLKEEMKPLMGVYITQLTNVLLQVSKNPANPTFNHYIFESYATVIKFNPGSVTDFENALFPIFEKIRQDDVQEFTPYVFQILSQLLELHPVPISQYYNALLPQLVQPTIWANEGNAPGVTSLICGISRKNPELVAQNVQQVLGVFQKLLASKSNDHFGFRILDSLTESLPTSVMSPYFATIFTLLFQRLQKNKTGKFLRCLVIFFSLFVVKNGGALLVQTIESIQAGLSNQVLPQFYAVNIHKIVGRVERKIAAVAVVKLLCETPLLLEPQMQQTWAALLLELVKFFELPEDTSIVETAEEPKQEQQAGYKVSFTKLSFAAKATEDPCKDIVSAKQYFAHSLNNLVLKNPQLKQGVWSVITNSNVQGKVGEYFASAGLNSPFQ